MPSEEIPIAVRGDVDPRAVEQLRRCAEAGDAVAAVLCADGHVGYSQPIGGAVAYPDHISPSGVGYDIACLAAGTRVTTSDGYHLPIERVHARAPVAGWDGRRLRVVEPCLGAISRGTRPALRLLLRNGRSLRLTADHLVRIPLGWREAGGLRPGDRVACAAYLGLPYEVPRGTLALPEPARAEALATAGLWPLPAADPRLPALLRLLGHLAGGGRLHRDGKAISWYTTGPRDAESLAADVIRLGFRPAIGRRSRRPNQLDEHTVRVGCVALHSLFAAMGCPVGRKVDGWRTDPMPWLCHLPRWLRAQFLAAFAGAGGTTPRLRADAGIAPLAIEQAGTTPAAVMLVRELLESLGFSASVTRSGPRRDAVTTWAAHLVGGTESQMRYFEQVGFAHALHKRVAAAAAASVAWQRAVERDRRNDAVEEAHRLRAAGGRTVLDVGASVASDRAPRALVHDRLYGRAMPRVTGSFAADHSGEMAWVEVALLEPCGAIEVFDVVTGDPAEAFQAEGCCVHNCGNKAVRTDVLVEDVMPDLPRVMDTVFERISFGVGRRNDQPVDHEVLDRIREAEFTPQRALRDLAAEQLGTVGAGNHYVDLFAGDDGHVWVGVHFGSRGFGHKTASGFLALAAGRRFDERVPEGEMDSPPVLLHVGSELGQAYIGAMSLAGEYAYAGRDVVVDRVLEILGATATREVHNHHNFAWRERHMGRDVWVIRKGCTPAFPGQEGFVGATMGEPSVILRGTDDPAGEGLLFSTVHGAGRVMSRTQAAGRMGNRAECSERDCGFWVAWGRFRHERVRAGLGEHERFTLCPRHPDGRMVKRRGRIKAGRIDFGAVQERLASSGIELRGGAADEAPDAYKRLDTVLAAHADTIEVLHRLIPIGVAMAAADTFDPYKD